jgi:hypothetical protein
MLTPMIEPFPLIEVSGPPRERGRQYGLAHAMGAVYATSKAGANNMIVSHADGVAIDFECAPDETFQVPLPALNAASPRTVSSWRAARRRPSSARRRKLHGFFDEDRVDHRRGQRHRESLGARADASRLVRRAGRSPQGIARRRRA